MAALASRWHAVRDAIAAACARAGRDARAVTCVAVSKFHPAAAVEEAMAAGLVAFGENYAQELAQKQAQLATVAAGEAGGGLLPQWHFIGSLQRNKTKLVAGKVALIHAVDSLALAQAIGRHALLAGGTQPILLAVNVGGEATKTGVEGPALASLLAQIAVVPGVRVDGLMTMPPPAARAEDNRGYFARLRELRDATATSALPLSILSMGMSDDYAVAIEEGATHVRIGTAIFGARPPIR